MSQLLRAVAVGPLLAGPAVLAFFSGGFFDRPRLWAGLAALALVVVAAALSPRPLPRGAAARAAMAGLALLTAWTGASIAWAPAAGAATDDLQRLLLYLAALVAAAALLRPAGVRARVEPALVLGSLAVVGFGLSERLLPGFFELSRSTSAGGRLEQPLTYWNAMGALAVLGLLLAVRVAGDGGRARGTRAAAAVAALPLALGVHLSFSRGALAALAVGTVVLVALAPGRGQTRTVALVALLAAATVAVAETLPWVRGLEGGANAAQGALMLAALGALGAVAAVGQWVLAGRKGRTGAEAPSARAQRGPAIALGLVVVLGAAVLVAATVTGDRARAPTPGADVSRLRSVQSNRYEYWRVALRSFADQPLFGVGSGGFETEWLRERPFPEPAQDAHSLPLETAAELGLVGLALLVLFGAGLATTVAQAHRAGAGVAGPAAALAAWTVHSALDWDWEMPALTLVALVLAGSAMAAADPPESPGRAVV